MLSVGILNNDDSGGVGSGVNDEHNIVNVDADDGDDEPRKPGSRAPENGFCVLKAGPKKWVSGVVGGSDSDSFDAVDNYVVDGELHGVVSIT